jgi:cytochrome c oxidase subunit 3
MRWQLRHLVNNSWLPLAISAGRFRRMLVALFLFKFGFRLRLLIVAIFSLFVVFYAWFRDVGREATYQGHHTWLVQGSLKWGLFWFLFREVWFFFSVFWTFFHLRTAPLTRGLWGWPCEGIFVISPFQVPLLNTVILLIRGLTATLAHHELLAGRQTIWVVIRVVLGVYFLTLQGVEYYSATFSVARGAYGRIFFFGTGFHGLHVCLGALILLVSSWRLWGQLLTTQHHFGLEFSLWYWHFVDVVWLFLFFWVYTWGA